MGATVEEVKQRMSYEEALHWFAYRQRHGGIGHARNAYLLAALCTMTNNAAGGKAELADFLPGARAADPEVIDDAEYMLRFWNPT